MTHYSKKGNGTGLPSGPEPCLCCHPFTSQMLSWSSFQYTHMPAHYSSTLHLLHIFLSQKLRFHYGTGYDHQHTQGRKINSLKASLTPLTLCKCSSMGLG